MRPMQLHDELRRPRTARTHALRSRDGHVRSLRFLHLASHDVELHLERGKRPPQEYAWSNVAGRRRKVVMSMLHASPTARGAKKTASTLFQRACRAPPSPCFRSLVPYACLQGGCVPEQLLESSAHPSPRVCFRSRGFHPALHASFHHRFRQLRRWPWRRCRWRAWRRAPSAPRAWRCGDGCR